jgi:iron complex transport system ATP-binding protein
VLKKLTKRGMPIVVSVHDPNHMMWFCDKVVVLHNGKIIANGKPRDVLTKDVLKTLYGDICNIKEDEDGLKMIMPNIQKIS